MSPTVLANMKQTFQTFSEGLGALDADVMTSTRADSCTQTGFLKSFGTPTRNIEEFRALFSSGGPLSAFKSLKVSGILFS